MVSPDSSALRLPVGAGFQLGAGGDRAVNQSSLVALHVAFLPGLASSWEERQRTWGHL